MKRYKRLVETVQILGGKGTPKEIALYLETIYRLKKDKEKKWN